MSDALAGAIVGALGLLGGAVIGGVGVALIGYEQVRLQVQHERAREWRATYHAYLLDQMTLLRNSFVDFQRFIGEHGYQAVEPREHSEIIGRAIAACWAIPDATLEHIGRKRFVPYPTAKEHPEYGKPPDRNRSAYLDAMQRLSTLIQELARSGELPGSVELVPTGEHEAQP